MTDKPLLKALEEIAEDMDNAWRPTSIRAFKKCLKCDKEIYYCLVNHGNYWEANCSGSCEDGDRILKPEEIVCVIKAIHQGHLTKIVEAAKETRKKHQVVTSPYGEFNMKLFMDLIFGTDEELEALKGGK